VADTADVAAHADADEAAGAEAEAAVDAPADSALCMVSNDSTLPGVSIAFRAPVACQFTLAQAQAGIAIPYDVVVAQDVAGVVPTQQDAGHCGTPGPSGLIVSGSVTGGGQTYCLCDIGFCAPSALPAVTLHAGTYAGTFSWQGRNWGGPSDTNNPMGAPFPTGNYLLLVVATGTHNGVGFQVNGALSITLTP
jgi:hypothetical protein